MRTRLFAVSLCLFAGLCRRRSRGSAVRRAPRRPTAPPARPTTSSSARTFWNPTPDIIIASEGARAARRQRRLRQHAGHRAEAKFTQFKVVLRPGDEAQVPLRVHADQLHGREDRASVLRLQRPALQRRHPGRDRAEVEGLPLRLRVGLHLPRPRLRRAWCSRRNTPTSTATLTAAAVGAAQFTRGARADPGHRLHRPRLRRPQHLDHRRVHRLQAARAGAATARTTRRGTTTSISTAP